MPLQSKLTEIAAALPMAVQEAVQAGADTIAESAKARVPVDTGRLQRAIHTQKVEEGVEVVAGDKEAWYGMLVEHGTRYVPARPFLLPALEENRARVVADIEEAIRRVT